MKAPREGKRLMRRTRTETGTRTRTREAARDAAAAASVLVRDLGCAGRIFQSERDNVTHSHPCKATLIS